MKTSDPVLYRRSSSEREQILRALRRALEARPGVAFAYVHGSFVEDRPVHDVDVAVYYQGATVQDADLLAVRLATELEGAIPPALRLPVDVRLLNEAPTSFRYHAFRGRLLFSRDEEARGRLVERAVADYLDRKPILDQALKEAMTA